MALPDPLDFDLIGILRLLNDHEFEIFKMILTSAYNLPEDLRHVSLLTMQLAHERQLAKILIDSCPSGWIERVTIQILQEMNRTDLAQLVEQQIHETRATQIPAPQVLKIVFPHHQHKEKVMIQGGEKPGLEHRRLWNNRLESLWRTNFWPGGSDKVYFDMERYQALLTFCNPKKTDRPFAQTLALHGLAGTGKTTMVKKLMLEWTRGKQGQVFDCAFYINCRETNHIECESFLFLLNKDNCLECVSGPLSQAQEVLFVVDGLDELRALEGGLTGDMCSDWEDKKSGIVLVSSLLRRKLVPNATLLVTTHPECLYVLRRLMNEQPLFLEATGFSEQEKQKYFLRHFKDEMRALRALDAVRSNSVLFDLASAPAVCWVVCTCLERQMEKEEDLVLTCQTCTSLFLRWFCNQFLPGSNSDHPKRNLQESLKDLCRLAHYAIQCDITIFHKKDFRLAKLKESNLDPFLERYILWKDNNCKDCYFFIHPTIMFLVAAMFYFLRDSEDRGEKRFVWSVSDLQKMFTRQSRSPGLTEVWFYLFGLLNENRIQELETTFGCQTSMTVKQELLQYRSEDNKPLFTLMDPQEVFYCLYESQEERFVKRVMAFFEEISLCLKTNTDLIRSSFCLKKCQSLQRMSLQVAKGLFPEKGAALEAKAQDKKSQDRRLIIFWEDLCSIFGSNKNLIFLDINHSFFNNSSLKVLCGKLSCTPYCLQKVVLKNISPANAYQNFCTTFTGYKTLKHLTLHDSNLNDTLPSLCKVLKHEVCNLQYLRLGFCSPSVQRWNDFFLALESNNSLTGLDIADNELLDKGAKLLCRALRQPNCLLQRVSLENCRLTETCCKELSAALMVTQKLTHLNLAKNNLGNGGVQILCEGLAYPECKLQTLVLWSCNITSDGCNHFSKLLRRASSLRQLDLGMNRLGLVGVKLICEALMEPMCYLESLWLYGCSITPLSCKDIANALRSSVGLSTLDLGQNSLGCDALAVLSNVLRSQICPLRTLRFKFDGANPENKKLLREIAENNPKLTINNDLPDPKKKIASSPYFIF